MQNSCSSEDENDTGLMDDGLDYIFAYMGAVYGASFTRHWEGNNPDIVRDVWKEILGRFLKHKESLDFALQNLPPDFPPSAIAFKNLCNAGPMISRRVVIPYQPPPDPVVDPEVKETALKRIREMLQEARNFKGGFA